MSLPLTLKTPDERMIKIKSFVVTPDIEFMGVIYFGSWWLDYAMVDNLSSWNVKNCCDCPAMHCILILIITNSFQNETFIPLFSVIRIQLWKILNSTKFEIFSQTWKYVLFPNINISLSNYQWINYQKWTKAGQDRLAFHAQGGICDNWLWMNCESLWLFLL